MLKQFDQFLKIRQLKFFAVTVGGVAISLLGILVRETRDCDVLDPDIPLEIALAAADFAKTIRARGEFLSDDWLNNGPSSLKKNLPKGWESKLQPIFTGEALSLQTLSRSDLLKTKIFAFCDRQTDRDDCIALKPTREELIDAYNWVSRQDAHPNWPTHVKKQFLDLAGKLGYGISENDFT